MFTSIIAFFTNIKEYLIIGLLGVGVLTITYLYIKSEDAKVTAGQAQVIQLETENDNLSKEVAALNNAMSAANSTISKIQSTASSQQTTIKSTNYNNTTATTEVNQLFGEIK
jgi:uncharacterized protein YlxW (UPF0749 family)